MFLSRMKKNTACKSDKHVAIVSIRNNVYQIHKKKFYNI